MNGFIFFLIFFFVIVPILKSINKSGKTKTAQPTPAQKRQKAALDQQLAEINAQVQRKPSLNTHGHSNARARVERDLHAGDTDKNVFTPEHAQKVKARERHDQAMRRGIEAALHSKNNTTIIRYGNKGMDGWGVRGDKQSTIWLWVLMLILTSLALYAQIPHNWLR